MSLLRDVMWKKKFNGHKIKHSIQKKYVQSCFQRMNENFKNANVVLLLFTTYRNVVGVIRSSPTLESWRLIHFWKNLPTRLKMLTFSFQKEPILLLWIKDVFMSKKKQKITNKKATTHIPYTCPVSRYYNFLGNWQIETACLLF